MFMDMVDHYDRYGRHRSEYLSEDMFMSGCSEREHVYRDEENMFQAVQELIAISHMRIPEVIQANETDPHITEIAPPDYHSFVVLGYDGEIRTDGVYWEPILNTSPEKAAKEQARREAQERRKQEQKEWQENHEKDREERERIRLAEERKDRAARMIRERERDEQRERDREKHAVEMYKFVRDQGMPLRLYKSKPYDSIDTSKASFSTAMRFVRQHPRDTMRGFQILYECIHGMSTKMSVEDAAKSWEILERHTSSDVSEATVIHYMIEGRGNKHHTKETLIIPAQ